MNIVYQKNSVRNFSDEFSMRVFSRASFPSTFCIVDEFSLRSVYLVLVKIIGICLGQDILTDTLGLFNVISLLSRTNATIQRHSHSPKNSTISSFN